MKSNQEIEKEEKLLVDTIQKILNLSREKISIEVSAKKTIGLSVNIRNSIIENIEFNSDSLLLMTVYNKFSKGTVSSKDFSENGIKNMLDMAIKISRYSSSDYFSGLPEKELLCLNSIDLDLFHPCDFSVKNAVQLSTMTERAAFKYDKRIVNSEGSFFDSCATIHIFGNSLGILQKYKSTRYSIYNCVISKDNHCMQRDFDYSISRKINDLKKPDDVGKNAAQKAISRIGSKKIRTMKTAVIFSKEVSSSFFSHLVHAISGDNICQRSTFLINDLNKKIFPEWLNIKEYPHIKQGLGSRFFDSEGVATKTKNIIKNGELKTWLLNSYNARKIGLLSTGNSGGISNWIISHRNVSFQELLKNMNQGILVTELIGQGVDIISGHYSRGVFGFWVDNGKIEHPVHEITISGNLRNMWRNIVSISNDIEKRNKIQCGSILISEMQISGN
ncbi:metalloprotease PmbA [Buchnera aphidicola (Muscaphis stroyani)]|uniref:Metalloprotease PmbA n=1 Tax=Buchnera aphidicola (Muscaphis stroyani) TaxID=1241869 RepID=A0A4D6YEF2_9GAMM|nr:metalloprotease PmbA [Buchnera aphidicola]QCI24194.1 metalloprotease PmbA [Buchnera aphidicola (Muscaphis stroyani)]